LFIPENTNGEYLTDSAVGSRYFAFYTRLFWHVLVHFARVQVRLRNCQYCDPAKSDEQLVVDRSNLRGTMHYSISSYL
jgi:hypothetical protein